MGKGQNKKIKLLNKETLILTAVVLLALALRLGVFFQLKANFPYFSNPLQGTDMLRHHQWAIAHLNGTFKEFPHCFNPLYPYFVAFIYLIFGQDILIAKIIQICLGCINCILIYFITKEIFDQKTGLIAAALTALYMIFIIYSCVLLVATLLTFLITIGILLLLRIRSRTSYLLAIGAGIFLGLAAIARGNNVLLIPAIMLWLLVILKGKGKKGILLPLVFLISSLSVISIISIQNYTLGGKFVPISTGAGIAFATGNCPGAQGWFHYPEWLSSTPQKRQAGVGESAFWVKETVKSIQEKPSRWLQLMFKKFCLFWYHREPLGNITQEQLKQYSFLLRNLPLFTFGIVAPLALTGIVISLKRWKALFLLYIFLFMYMCTIILAFMATRFRIPFVQILIPFAAFTICQGYIKLREKDFKYIGFIILLLIPFFVLTRAYDIYKVLEKQLYIRSHPWGTYILSNNTLTIRDDRRRSQDDIFTALDAPKERLKKNLFVNIERDLSEIEKAYLELPFVCLKKEGSVILEVNNYPAQKIKCTQIFSGEQINLLRIALEPSLLIQGENSFIFSVSEGAMFIVPIDNSYNYRRSAFSSNLGLDWDYSDLSPDIEGKNKGEYMMSLYLEFFR